MAEDLTTKLGIEPRYTLRDAAILAGTTPNTLKRWVSTTQFAGAASVTPPLIKLDSQPIGGILFFSFFNVIEAGFLAAYRNEGVPMPRVRSALDYVQQRMISTPRPLLGPNFERVGKDLLAPYVAETGEKKILNASKSGQVEWPEAVQVYFRSIEYDQHGPILLWLYSERRIVGIDPRLAFGRPVIVRNGLRTDAIESRFAAGEPIEEIAEEFSIPLVEVEEAIRWENESLRRAA